MLARDMMDRRRFLTASSLPLSSGIVSADKAAILPYDLDVDALGAAGDGRRDDHALIQEAIVRLDRMGGGRLRFGPKLYHLGSSIRLPMGIDLIAAGSTLLFSQPGGDGIVAVAIANPARRISRIHGFTFSRLGSDGGAAIRTLSTNKEFFAASPYWDVRHCVFRDHEAPFMLPASKEALGRFGWACCFDLGHSNGSVFEDNDVFGAFDPKRMVAGQLQSIGVRLGTDGTNGVIATSIRHNRLWYLHTALHIGEDVLAFWFNENECIKCYRGVYAPSDERGDGVVCQADTRIFDNYITTCVGGIDLHNRQLLHIDRNHTNSDPSFFDNGQGFTGIRITNGAKCTISGNSANLAKGHAAWAGEKEAVRLHSVTASSVINQSVSRYFDHGVTFSGSSRDCFSTQNVFVQLSGYGHRFLGEAEIMPCYSVYAVEEPRKGRFFFERDAPLRTLELDALGFLQLSYQTGVGSDTVTPLDAGGAQANLSPSKTNIDLGSKEMPWATLHAGGLALNPLYREPPKSADQAVLFFDHATQSLLLRLPNGQLRTITLSS